MGNLFSHCMDNEERNKYPGYDLDEFPTIIVNDYKSPSYSPMMATTTTATANTNTQEDQEQDDSASSTTTRISFDKLFRNAQPYINENAISKLFHNVIKKPNKIEDYNDDDENDYRGFAFCIHPKYGILLLHCTRKKKKGPHYQIPGGHVDQGEFEQFQHLANHDFKQQCYMAARAACVREIYEETGMTIAPERLWPAMIVVHRQQQQQNQQPMKKLPNEYKQRFFFVISLTDQDFQPYQESSNDEHDDDDDDDDHHQKDKTKNKKKKKKKSSLDDNHEYWAKLSKAQTQSNHAIDACPLRLKLSIEHSGFRFEKNPLQAIKLLNQHSGGKVAEALMMALNYNNDNP